MDAMILSGGVAQVFPVVAGVVARRRLNPGRRWIVAWGVYSVAATALSWALRRGSNLWLLYFATPIEGSLILMALSCWQERALFRAALRWAVPAALVVHVLEVVLLENRNGFSVASMPSYAILGLAAALFTLISRSLSSSEALLRQDWFWVSGGLALYLAAYALVAPLSAVAIRDRAVLLQVIRLFNLVNVVAYAIVAVGLLCPRARTGIPA